jgi:hypothetical protein
MMPDEVLSPSARMSAAFSRLRESAKEIKATSDELTRAVQGVERALEHLHLRVACWTLLSEWTAFDQDEFRREYVGYIEVRKQWRIVVRTSEGFASHPDESDDITWAFDDAPQYLRIKAVDKLPELIESLVLTVEKTTERLKKKIAPTQELAKAVANRPANQLPITPASTTPAISSTPLTSRPPTPGTLGALVRPRAEMPAKGTTPVTPRSEKKS